jgi:hypothetical protein
MFPRMLSTDTIRAHAKAFSGVRRLCVYRKLDSAIFVVKATENWV